MIYFDINTAQAILPEYIEGVIKQPVYEDQVVGINGDGEQQVEQVEVGYTFENLPDHIKGFDENDPRIKVKPGQMLVFRNGEPVLKSRPVLEPKEIPTTVTSRTFMALFTTAELQAIYDHAALVFDCKLWIDQVLAASHIDYSDLMFTNGMAYLLFEGLLTETRYNEIVSFKNE